MSETSNDNLDGGENDRLDVIRLVGPLTPATDSQTWLRDRGHVVKESVVVRVQARRRRTRSASAASFAAVTLVAVALVVRNTNGTVSTQNQPTVTTAGTTDPGPTPTTTAEPGPSVSTAAPAQDMFGPWIRRPIEFGPLAGARMYTPMDRELFVVNDDVVSILTVATGAWRSGTRPPRSLNFNVAGATWTGTELLLWGSARADENSPPDDGLAYNPRTDTWRGISDAPIDLNHPQAYGYTDGELFVWGDSQREAAAYAPATNTWRTLRSTAPAGVTGALHPLVEKSFLGLSRSNANALTVATYDGALDSWTESPDSLPGGNMSSTVLLNGDLIVLEGEATGYDGPANVRLLKWSRDSGWTKLDSPPIGTKGSICDQSLVVIAGELLASRCGQNAYPHDGEWRAIGSSLEGYVGYRFAIADGIIEKYDTSAAYIGPPPNDPASVSTTDEPLFTLTSLCYGTCFRARPPGLPTIVVYDNGTVFVSDLTQESLAVRQGDATDAEVQTLRQALTALGAVKGDAVFAGCQVSEGEDLIVSRSSGQRSTVTTWMFFDPVPDCQPSTPDDVSRLQKLNKLREIVMRIRDNASTPAKPTWALLAQTPREFEKGDAPTWPGVDPAGLPATGPFSERCVLMSPSEFTSVADLLTKTPRTSEVLFAHRFLVDGVRWRIWGRPLLPHERTCDDTRNTAERLLVEAWKVEN
jgi:hypothetical protein